MARTPLIAGNWKMHLDHREAVDLVRDLGHRLDRGDLTGVDVAVLPAFTALRAVQVLLEADRIPFTLGAQNCHWEESGAFTGEVAPGMLAALSCRYVVAGHSERRHVFGESDETVNRKVHAILAAGMTPILCVGETQEERDADRASDVVVAQLDGSLAKVADEQVAGMVIAYEPVWAIGTGRTATPDDAQDMCALVRQVVGDRFGQSASESVRIQYGGSVKPGNATSLLSQPDVDGALVGGASLDADDFAAVVRATRR